MLILKKHVPSSPFYLSFPNSSVKDSEIYTQITGDNHLCRFFIVRAIDIHGANGLAEIEAHTRKPLHVRCYDLCFTFMHRGIFCVVIWYLRSNASICET